MSMEKKFQNTKRMTSESMDGTVERNSRGGTSGERIERMIWWERICKDERYIDINLEYAADKIADKRGRLKAREEGKIGWISQYRQDIEQN